MSRPKLKYRPEIDGLRALAIFAIIFYHAGFDIFSGGYIGVDVFFVISGYLITSIIINDIKNNTFSFLNFYERRIRRLFPALFFMLIGCIPFALYTLSPVNLDMFFKGVIGVITLSSNILFWRQLGDYFEISATTNPLIHTWSLSVEEQFYLIFPIFLLTLCKISKNWRIFLLVTSCFGSLFLAQVLSSVSPFLDFYMLPTRIWEFIFGAIIPIINLKIDTKKATSQIASLIGLLLVLIPCYLYDESIGPPSLFLTIPVMGSSLMLIYANKDTLVGKILSARFFVWIGLISYSTYLWHQPIFSFARLSILRDLNIPERFFLVLLSFLFGYLSWKFIEKPFKNYYFYKKYTLYLIYLICCIFLVGISAYALKHKFIKLLTIKDCLWKESDFPRSHCNFNGNGDLKVVVWGDSHAMVLSETIPEIKEATIYVISVPGCPPILGVRRNDGLQDSVACNKLGDNKRYIDYIESLNPDIVILTARWQLYLNGLEKPNLHLSHTLSTSDYSNEVVPYYYRQKSLQQQLSKTVEVFRGKSKVFILSQPPDYADKPLNILQRTNFTMPLSNLLNLHKGEIEILENISMEFPEIKVLDSKSLFCKDNICLTRMDSKLLYTDDNHLTANASKLQWRLIEGEVLKEQKNK